MYASPDNVPSYCCTRIRIHIYLQCPRQYIDIAAAAARDSAEIITNVYISIICILCYNIMYPSRENPFGFGCSDNVSPGCIFWYGFMISIFSFTPAWSTTKLNELTGAYFFLFNTRFLNVCISHGKRMSCIS